MSLRLDELGEDRIVAEILAPRYTQAGEGRFGDDTALLGAVGNQRVVATVDPCPPPAAYALGFQDLYYMGWLAVTINLSDLAASGAKPAGLLSSLQLPGDLEVDQLMRLLDGMDACAAEFETSVIGGNIKEAGRIDVTITAMGVVDGAPSTRAGGVEGDALVAVGPIGAFWAEFLRFQKTHKGPLSSVLTPRPQMAAGRALRESDGVRAVTDNSDGLTCAVAQLADASRLGVHLEADRIEFSAEVRAQASLLGLHPFNLAAGWGDWNLVCAVERGGVEALVQDLATSGVEAQVIGHLCEPGRRSIEFRGTEQPFVPLKSQRLTQDSWMTKGLPHYISPLRTWPD